MGRKVLATVLLAIGSVAFLLAASDENGSATNPRMGFDTLFPAEVLAGSCFEGTVANAVVPISVGSIWDDDQSVILNTSGFDGPATGFEFWTSVQDVGRTFTIFAVDLNGNIATLTVTVVL